MKQVYLSLLLAGLTAAPALGQKTTVNAFPKPLAPVANAGMKAPQFHLPSAIDDKKKGITMYAGQRLDQSKHRSWPDAFFAPVRNAQQIVPAFQ